MGVSINCALVINAAAFGSPSGDESPKVFFFDLIHRNV